MLKMMWGESSSVSIDHSSILLECVDDVHGCDGQALAVLGVGEAVPDHSFQEVVDVVSHVFVAGVGDSPDAASPGESSDCAVGDDTGGGLFCLIAFAGLFGCGAGGLLAHLASSCH